MLRVSSWSVHSVVIATRMSEPYHYLDSFYRSTYSPNGESVDSGSTNFQYGFSPSHPSFGFGEAVASTSSARASTLPQIQTASDTVWFAIMISTVKVIVLFDAHPGFSYW